MRILLFIDITYTRVLVTFNLVLRISSLGQSTIKFSAATSVNLL